jgi:thiamine-monophosphate kinase
MPEALRIMDVGETEALKLVLPLLPTSAALTIGPGDDAAVLAVPSGAVVISSDMMIEGPDFRLDWSSFHNVGVKAIASNAADIAAMGATPLAFQLSVALPPETLLEDLVLLAKGFASGIEDLCPGAGVTGGDLSSAPVLTVAVTVFGFLDSTPAITRFSAKPGDQVCVAGELGLSHRGYRELVEWSVQPEGTPRPDSAAVRHHVAPRPPIHLGPVAAHAGATAMMDISDGLVLDATRMATASGVVMRLDTKLAGDKDALFGGEDHGLLATFPPTVTPPEGFVVIGAVEASTTAPEVLIEGVDLSQVRGGWDPFQTFVAK